METHFSGSQKEEAHRPRVVWGCRSWCLLGTSIPMSDLRGLTPCISCLSFIRRCRTPRTDPAAGAGTWSAGRGPRGPHPGVLVGSCGGWRASSLLGLGIVTAWLMPALIFCPSPSLWFCYTSPPPSHTLTRVMFPSHPPWAPSSLFLHKGSVHTLGCWTHSCAILPVPSPSNGLSHPSSSFPVAVSESI